MIPADEILVTRTRAGNSQAYAQLVERYQSLVCAIAFAVTGDQALSEDVAQEAFLAGWRQIDSLQDAGSFRSWIVGVARNQGRKAQRRQGATVAATELTCPTQGPLEELSQQQTCSAVWAALEAIPESYREPLVLFYRQEQSIREVAHGLNITEAAAQQRLSRGRGYLKGHVTALVEQTLQGTRPRAGFAAAVMSLLVLGNAGGAAAEAANSSSAWNVGALGKLAVIGATLLVGMFAGLWLWSSSDKSDQATPGIEQRSAATTPGPSRRLAAQQPSVTQDKGAVVKSYFDDPTGSLRVEGIVLDEDEIPVAGAYVAISTSPARRVITGGDGSFAFDGLLHASYELEAYADKRYAGISIIEITATTEPLTMTLRQAHKIRVHVADAWNKPIEGARVELEGIHTRLSSTDETGTTVLTAVPPTDRVVLAVSAPGYGPVRRPARSFVNSSGSFDLRIVMTTGQKARGTVVDESGNPIKDVEVKVLDAGQQAVLSDELGVWELGRVEQGMPTITASHPMYATALIYLAVKSRGEELSTRLVLKKARVLSGVVVTSHGDAVPGATVTIMPSEMPRYRVISDADGVFHAAFPTDGGTINARSSDAASADYDLNAMKGSELSIVVEHTNRISGVVRSASGEVLAEAVVYAKPVGEAARLPQWWQGEFPHARSDYDGGFVIQGLPEGDYEVSAPQSRNKGYAPAKGIRVKSGASDVEVIAEANVQVRGRIEVADGGPMPVYRVATDFYQGATDYADDGLFVLQSAPASLQTITVAGPELCTQTVEIPSEGSIRDVGTIIVKRCGPVVRGTVRASDGTPVPGAIVELKYAKSTMYFHDMLEGALYPRARSDLHGHYEIHRSKLTYQQSGFAQVVATHRVGRSEVKRFELGQQQVDLTLQATGALRGKLSGGHLVHVVGEREPTVEILATGDGRRYFLEHLLPDRYQIFVNLDDVARQVGEVVVEANEESIVDIEAPDSVQLLVAPNSLPANAIYLMQVRLTEPGLEFTSHAALEDAEFLADQSSVLGGGRDPRVLTIEPGDYTLCVSFQKADQVERATLRFGSFMNSKPWCRALTATPGAGKTEVVVDLSESW